MHCIFSKQKMCTQHLYVEREIFHYKLGTIVVVIVCESGSWQGVLDTTLCDKVCQ